MRARWSVNYMKIRSKKNKKFARASAVASDKSEKSVSNAFLQMPAGNEKSFSSTFQMSRASDVKPESPPSTRLFFQCLPPRSSLPTPAPPPSLPPPTIRKKLFVFSLFNIIANVLLGCSWLLWMCTHPTPNFKTAFLF